MYIGLDLGTSGLKAVLVDDDQSIRAEATAPLTVSRPQDGWSEQAPEDWNEACDRALRELGGKADLSGVRALGLSGQQHGATLIGADGAALRPCMLWNDTRAFRESADLDAGFRAAAGNMMFPGFTAPKVEWVRRHEPDVFAKIDKVLLPKDALRAWLSGGEAFFSDMSDASGTGWLDPATRDWNDDLLAATGLTRANMPALVEGSGAAGTISAERARAWGLPEGVVIAGGGGDNAASAVGVGVVRDGEAFLSLGTSAVLFVASGAFQPDPNVAIHTFCHALPDTWHQMGVILAAADALNWWARISGEKAADMVNALGPLQAPAKTLFLPYLGGERTPYNDAQVRASFLYLDHATDRAAMTRAVVEGVTHAVRDSYDALRATGTTFSRLIAVGGGSRSDYWLSAVATSLGMPVEVPEAGDFGGAFGAARLARMAATGEGAEIATAPRIARTYDPDPALQDAFAEAHGRYTDAYQAIKGR